MKYNFCTLFDSGFMDKGIALYKSLEKQTNNFHLYVFAFDQKAYDVLLDMALENMTVTFIDDIEDDRMRKVRLERTKAEYCWTCTPIVIEHTLDFYKVDNCTYIDADMYFYSNPTVLINELVANNADILITRHGFPNNREGKITERKNGRYCVQFNTILDTTDGRKALSWWKEQCLLCCSSVPIDGKFGDQKYIETIADEFPRVYETDNFGAGVANWNITRFKADNSIDNQMIITDKETGKKEKLIFYHFHGLKEMSGGRVDISVYRNRGKVDDKLVQYIYRTYLDEIRRVRRLLCDEYHLIYPMISSKKNKSCILKPKIREKISIEERYYVFIRMIKARVYRHKDIMVI